MKKILFALIALTAVAYAEEAAVKVKVVGDRVSLRAVPDTNAVLLGRTMLGDELVLKDNSNPEWVGILPPETIDLWVSGEFVSDKTVRTELLNIRSGPSLSHSVVGTASSGTVLNVRGEIAQWLKIAPTSNTTVWVSRKYVDAPGAVITEPVAVPSSTQKTQTVVQAVAEPTVQEVMTSISAASKKKLVEDSSKLQGVEGTYYGVLRPFDGTLYQLVDDHFTDITVCYVRGNEAQMKTFTGMRLQITGKVYWVEGMDLPVVNKPTRIRLLPTEKK
ncbi:MAG: SH3 domain-containing protein [Kiritimatiellaceae bacterium]|nr:SH3 domain-containing protein [Kiritimatiellaceae bacterium]